MPPQDESLILEEQIRFRQALDQRITDIAVAEDLANGLKVSSTSLGTEKKKWIDPSHNHASVKDKQKMSFRMMVYLFFSNVLLVKRRNPHNLLRMLEDKRLYHDSDAWRFTMRLVIRAKAL